MPISAANLKWFYSGGANNSDPSLSIGGAVSSVQLSTTTLHNLFDRVTGDEAEAGMTRYRLLYFKNVDADADGLMAPVVLYFATLPFNGDTIQMGISAQGKNAAATAITNEFTAPSGVSFAAPVSKASSTLVLPSPPYVQNEYIGVWFKHVVPALQTASAGNAASWVVVGDTV
jgi:hypothetical protein